MFKAAKDAFTSEAARRYVNGVIARYGKVQEFRIDSSRQRMHAVCQLDGEPNPITVDIENYAIVEQGDKKVIQVNGLKCSRIWLERLLEDYVKGRPIVLPSWAAAAL